MAGSLLLILSVGFSAFICHRNLSYRFRDARITLISSSVFWISAGIYASTGLPFSELIEDLAYVTASSLILIALLMMIRELKPEIFRYPYLAVFMPVVIPVSYYLIYQTSMIRETIVHSVSGMIVLVALIISIGYKDRTKPFISVLGGGFLLFVALAVSVLLDDEQYIHLIWYAVTGTGIALTSYGFVNTFNENNKYLQNEEGG